MSACQQESVNQAGQAWGQAWCDALEDLRNEVKELRADHLETKGKFSGRLQEEAPVGESAAHLRLKDNLHPEGKFEGRTSGSAAPRGNNDANYGIPDSTTIVERLPGKLA